MSMREETTVNNGRRADDKEWNRDRKVESYLKKNRQRREGKNEENLSHLPKLQSNVHNSQTQSLWVQVGCLGRGRSMGSSRSANMKVCVCTQVCIHALCKLSVTPFQIHGHSHNRQGQNKISCVVFSHCTSGCAAQDKHEWTFFQLCCGTCDVTLKHSESVGERCKADAILSVSTGRKC